MSVVIHKSRLRDVTRRIANFVNSAVVCAAEESMAAGLGEGHSFHERLEILEDFAC